MNERKELERGIKFILFSISAGVIEFVSFALLDGLTQWHYWPKYLIALILSVLWNFTLNRRFTFRSAGNVPIAMLKVACFYAVFTPVSTVVGNYLAENYGWNDLLVTILNMAVNLVTEYLYDRFFVFGKTIDTIGDGAIIGANSVVGSNVDPYTIVVGNPARVLRKRFDDELIDLMLRFRWWDIAEFVHGEG